MLSYFACPQRQVSLETHQSLPYFLEFFLSRLDRFDPLLQHVILDLRRLDLPCPFPLVRQQCNIRSRVGARFQCLCKRFGIPFHLGTLSAEIFYLASSILESLLLI